MRTHTQIREGKHTHTHTIIQMCARGARQRSAAHAIFSSGIHRMAANMLQRSNRAEVCVCVHMPVMSIVSFW